MDVSQTVGSINSCSAVITPWFIRQACGWLTLPSWGIVAEQTRMWKQHIDAHAPNLPGAWISFLSLQVFCFWWRGYSENTNWQERKHGKSWRFCLLTYSVFDMFHSCHRWRGKGKNLWTVMTSRIDTIIAWLSNQSHQVFDPEAPLADEMSFIHSHIPYHYKSEMPITL